MLCTANTGNHFRFGTSPAGNIKAFYAHKPFLVNKNVTMQDRFRYFDAMFICCLFRCCLQKSVQTRSIQDGSIQDGCCAPLLGHLVTWIGRCQPISCFYLPHSSLFHLLFVCCWLFGCLVVWLFGFVRFCLVLFGFVWCYLVLFGVVWCCLVLFGVVWCCLVLFGVWCCLGLFGWLFGWLLGSTKLCGVTMERS